MAFLAAPEPGMITDYFIDVFESAIEGAKPDTITDYFVYVLGSAIESAIDSQASGTGRQAQGAPTKSDRKVYWIPSPTSIMGCRRHARKFRRIR